MLLIDPAFGGQATISTDDYVEKAPEWVGEVSASSVSFDLHTKLNIYRRNGVREYLVWRVDDKQIDWFALHADEFQRLVPDEAGILRSEIFPGLWLDPAALVGGDMPRVIAVLQQGLPSPDHAAFVSRLSGAQR